MDVFAHGLWTNALYRVLPPTRNNKKTIWWGVVFGLLPDLVSFTPVFAYYFAQIFLGRSVAFGHIEDYPNNPFFEYAVQSYNISHSMVIYLVGAGLIWLLIRKFPWFTLGWGLHILIDIFSHTQEFFATPFLYPISNFKISVISWSHPTFMVINYVALALFYFWLYPKLKRRFVK